MKQLFFVILFLTPVLVLSQSIDRQLIGATGKTINNSNFGISFSVGEPIVGLMIHDVAQLSNGYYPAMQLQMLTVEDAEIDLQFRVYPNPTSQFLYVSHPEVSAFEVQISDLNGKQLYLGTMIKEQPIDVSAYLTGMFFITIQNKDSNKKNTYKFIKK